MLGDGGGGLQAPAHPATNPPPLQNNASHIKKQQRLTLNEDRTKAIDDRLGAVLGAHLAAHAHPGGSDAGIPTWR